jgi:alcohol dehydrogenase (cytochrome c)
MGAYYRSGRDRLDFDFENGPPNFGGGGQSALSGDDAWGAIRALEATTGKLKWEYKLVAPAWVSTLSTAGGLVFSGSDEGNFFALDAATGKLLWQFPMGGGDHRNNHVTYEVSGKQYIVAASGNAFVAFTLP